MSRAPARLRALLREPLVHFVILGALIFGVHARVRRPPEERIIVSAAFVEGLRDEHRRRAGRPPTEDELRGIVERYVDEEVLYREAVALGLDRGDVIVRRRLAQKMQFLLEDEAGAIEPGDAELQAWLDAHPDRYRAPEAISFQQVFVSRDRHGEAMVAEAERLFARLRAGEDPGGLGEPFLQGNAWARRTAKELESTFGPGFADGVFAAKQGEWTGPILSSHGAHLVRVSARESGRVPPLATVRARVREDWRAARREELQRAALERLKRRYQVVVE